MIPLTLGEVATAVRGTLHDAPDADVRVEGPVLADSREAVPGSLFVAVKGERADGHDHAAAAVEAGAVAVLAARPVGVPAVVVDDPVAALGLLARAVLDRLGDLTVVGLTGSSGKTSTKDLLAQLLEQTAPTVAPQGSFNTEIGVPLTALRADAATRHLVVEMGARGPGHIAYLCGITPPRVGVVLNVGLAHAGEFGGREATAVAKRELVEALPAGDAGVAGLDAGGVAVLNADDPLVLGMAQATAARVVTFGRSAGTTADVRAEDVRLDDRGRPGFTLVTPEGTAPVQLRLYGEHHVSNALAAAAVAREFGMPVDAVGAALGAAVARSRWRMEVTERADGVTVVNDAYNANPDSVRAALEAVAAMARGRRTWAVLGEMLELGATSLEEHEAVGRLAARLGVARLVAVGEGARPVHLAASAARRQQLNALREQQLNTLRQQQLNTGGNPVREESVFVPNADAALALLRDEVRPGDVVLVKASRMAGLERVAAGLLEPGS